MASGGLRNIPIPRPLSLTGNVVQNWKTFKRDFTNYEIATKLTEETMEIRVATLLSCIGSDAMNIFDGLTMTDSERKKIPEIFKAFEKYCVGETNETYERFIFNSRNQQEGETVEKYIAELRRLSKSCNFENLEDSLIRDRVVMGVKCDITRRKLLQESNLNLTKATTIARTMEISKGQMTRIKKEGEGATEELVQKLRSSNFPPNKKGSTKNLKNCHFCNKAHVFKKELCPAYGKTCNMCKGKNHFAGTKHCRANIKLVTDTDDSHDLSDVEEDDIWLAAVGNGRPRATATLKVNEQNVKFQLDTGSDVNTICQRYVKKQQVTRTNQKLTMWNKTKLKPIGEVTLETRNPKTGTTHMVPFTVVPNSLSCLLGVETLKTLGFITLNEERYIAKLDSNSALGDPDISTNSHSSLGDLGEAHLHTDTTKTPKQLPCRRIPFALQAKVKTQIAELVERGVLTPETEPTEWVSQMALAEKANGDIRICIDPAPLNEALMREHYKLPTLDDVLGQLNGARLFTKLDVKEAYWHIRLDEESSKLTTMITPFGRYRWLRLPFGLKVSSEIFQRKITEALDGLINTSNVADDIVVAGRGKDEEEARANLRQNSEKLKQRCKERHILLNDTKEIAEEPKITFMGHLLTANGISPDPAKVTAIKNMPAPTDVSAVRRLCGTVQYLARFIPNLAEHLEPMRVLTRKNADWNWTAECQQAFEKIKKLITEDALLAYFDMNKELFLQVDSSQSGVGCFLHQNGRPIEYASKTLTNTQRRWAQIEKELLSVVIGLERFDQYTYGRKVIVQNDHKPLEQIIRKTLSQVPRRLQNLLMRLHRYDITFQYVEGSKLHVADTLSRAVAGSEAHEIPDLQIHIVSVSGVSDTMMEKIREATKADETLQRLAWCIRDGGWQDDQASSVTAFKPIKDILSIEDDILYKGEQIIVPRSLRAEVKQKLHAAHLGYDSMMRRARSTIYWPGMKDEIKQLAETCDVCQRRKPANQKEPLQQHEEGGAPWERVGIDFFDIKEHSYIVIVDYLSTYIEVEHMNSTTSQQTIKTLKKTFSRWGIPKELVSDNGPQLTSQEFKDFLKSWGIAHNPSDPLYPKGNGKAEAAVKVIKNMLQKCHENGDDPYMALLELRATPRQDVNMSPAEIMLGRQPRTLIPAKTKATMNTKYQNLRDRRRESIKKCYDKGTKTLKEIATETPVYYKNTHDKWCPGKVTGKNGRKYQIQGENGGEYIRNRVHIRPKATPFDETFEAVMLDQEVSQPVTNGRRPARERRAPLWHNDYVHS